jgi:response regulator RpfG family c-di-GMP phosphodiesterase
LAQAIAKEMDLADLWLDGLRLAAHVYDIGFMNMPDDIIHDSGQLTGSKLTMYRNYPQLSYDILKEVDFPTPVAYIVLEHRECFDGSGFPQGLRGADIVLEARILAVADAIEDLTCERTFRNAFTLREALEEVSSHSGSWYDPNVVAACLRLFNEKGYKMSG